MRTNDEFKKYVYEKAEKKGAKIRKNRAVFLRTAAAFSILFIVGGVLLYKNGADVRVTTATCSGTEELGFIQFNECVEETQAEICAIPEMSVVADDSENATGYTSRIDLFNNAKGAASDYSVSTEAVCESESAVRFFDFSEVEKKLRAEDAGVKKYGFNNTNDFYIKDENSAVELAKKEVTVEYDSVSTAYDSSNEIWEICFSKKDTVGGCQTVYLNNNGRTLVIVYGE